MSTPATQPAHDPVEAARAALFDLCDFPLDQHDSRARNAIDAALDELAQLRASEAHDAARLLAQEVRLLAECRARVAELEAHLQGSLWALAAYRSAVLCGEAESPALKNMYDAAIRGTP